MRVVLDTNILLVSFSKKSPFYWIWKSLLENKLILCVTTDILLEYEEIITRHTNAETAAAVLDAITDLPNIQFITKYIFWELISEDPDDNKFVDCAIAARAKYLVSEDKHFRKLKDIDFPKVEVIGIEEFKTVL